MRIRIGAKLDEHFIGLTAFHTQNNRTHSKYIIESNFYRALSKARVSLCSISATV